MFSEPSLEKDADADYIMKHRPCVQGYIEVWCVLCSGVMASGAEDEVKPN